MKGIYTIILGIGSFFTSIYGIYQLNTVGEAASLSFAAENYSASIQLYHQLIDSLDYPHPEAKLNLAHSYYRSGDTTMNRQLYTQLTIEDTNRTIRSLAHQQLGAIRYDQQDIEKALEKYKQALKANPYNEEARFNYELLKKRQQDPNQEQEKDKQQQDKEQNKDQKDNQDQKDKQQGDKEDQQNQQGDQKDQQKDNKGQGEKDKQDGKNGQKDKQNGDKGEQEKQKNSDQQQSEKKDGEKGKGDQKDGQKKDEKQGQKPGEKQDKKGEKEGEALSPEEQKRQEEAAERAARAERFEKSGMNEKTAEMLLNASRQREKQYLQQLKKRSSKSPESDKPDW